MNSYGGRGGGYGQRPAYGQNGGRGGYGSGGPQTRSMDRGY